MQFLIRLNIDDDIMYFSGRYELHSEAACFQSLLKPGMTVIDIGANLGLYSLVAAKAVGPEGKVFGFEPVPAIMKRFRENIALNQLPNITAVACAVGERIGSASFYLNEIKSENSGLGSLVRPIGDRMITVETITLDEFKIQNNIQKISMVKIDVEGAEHLVLDGMKGILHDDRPTLLVEHNDAALSRAGSSAKALFDRIVSMNYSAFLLKDGKMVPVKNVQPPLYKIDDTSNYIFTPQ